MNTIHHLSQYALQELKDSYSEHEIECICKIIYMDVVTHAGAVFCIVIVSKDGNILSLVVRYLKNQRDQMCFRIMSLTNFSIRMRTTGIKVAQGNIS